MLTGKIKRYDFRKGFGFITEEKAVKIIFSTKSEWDGNQPIKPGISVKFDSKESEKGTQAANVVPADGDSKAPSAKPSKPKSLDARISDLESSVAVWKVISGVALIAAATALIITLIP